MVKFLKNLQEAEKIIRTINHLIYSNIPVIKEKNMLIKFLEELNLAATKCIESILYYEYINNKINLSTDKKINLNIFMNKCASSYGINSSEKIKIIQLFNLHKNHKQSPFEFKHGEKIIILSQDSTPSIFNIKIAKEFLELEKTLLKKTITRIRKKSKIGINIKRLQH